MPEPAPLGPRRLWRAVIRPLAEEGTGDVLCDVADGSIAEGLLVTTKARVHAVGGGEPLERLAQIYRDRVVFHPSSRAAWAAAAPCRLAVLDAGRSLDEHVSALRELAESGGTLPPVLVQGVSGAGAAGVQGTFSRQGWAVVELPGFDQIRLVVPGGHRVTESIALDRILERLASGAQAAVEPRGMGDGEERVAALTTRVGDLQERLADAEARRELAEQRRATTEDLVVTLRLFRDDARADLQRAREQTEDMRRQLEAARADVAEARARNARFSRVQRGVRDDLERLQDSQSWRLGHWLTRAGRILTFRKPGRTDAVSKALERLDAITPSGDAHH
jgi:hypothetical protein